MRLWIAILKGFGYIWIVLGAVLIAIGIAGTWMKVGFTAVQDLMSPFNVVNWLAIAITLAPGLAALAWSSKLKSKHLQKA